MGERGARRAIALRWLLGGVGLTLAAVPLCAQLPSQDPNELDPSAPLDPMPDLGVEWPDMNQPEPAPPPEVEAVTPEAAQQSTEATAERVEDIAATRKYRWTITGIENLPDASAIRAGFDARSVLEGDEGKAANAAQIDRRARADA